MAMNTNWEREFDEKWYLHDYKYDCYTTVGEDVKYFIRTKLEEAYQKGREDAVDCIVNLKITPEGQDTKTTAELITIAWEIIKPSLLENIEARHAGEVSKEV